MPPEMVLFDCYGVLVDSEILTAEVLRANLARHGLSVSHAQLDEFFLGGTIMGVEKKAREMGADLPPDWIDEMYAEIFEVLDAQVKPVAGVIDVLDALDASGIPYAVGSNGPHRKMQITGLQPRKLGDVICLDVFDVISRFFQDASHDLGIDQLA